MKNNSLANISVQQLKGVGPQLATKLENFHIHSIQDLLFHLPLRYVDRTRITPIGHLRHQQDVVIEGEIIKCNVVFGRRRSLMCQLQDGSGIITLRFFHFSQTQKNNLSLGTRLRCFGEVRRGASGLELYHPEYTRLAEDQVSVLEEHLTPIYPSTEGITQQRWRLLMEQALIFLKKGALTELLPNDLCPENLRADIKEAVLYLHKPPTDANQALLLSGTHPFQQRLCFEELLAHHLSLLRIRARTKQQGAPALIANQSLENKFLKQLPFALTQAQERVAKEISEDLAKASPMLRLVQGDVGSGKTVVAALAALQAISNGKQAVIMAPTEILAEQHLKNFSQWFESLDIEIAWLSSRIKGKKRETQLELLASGKAPLAIGTHALLQDDVIFHDLALVVIDEQHRFGVHQRLRLKGKGGKPHQLIMTATPIPRTLAMSLYADLDCSIIDELPPGRTPVNTVLIEQSRRDRVMERIRHACSEGRQGYWVCTLIEESEELQCEAAETTAALLTQQLTDINIGLVHGRMKNKEKSEVMDSFKAGNIQLLVATTVIEVGVDVPNASIMVIENPERLGLAQLHQLRGRVGRGATASHCVLLYGSPLSQQAKSRLNAMRDTNDGFVIAEKDLELRGPGELLGIRQTGDISFYLADLQRDAHLLTAVKQSAEQLAQTANELIDPLIKRWLGNNEQYAEA